MIFIIEIDCFLDDVDILQILRELLIGKSPEIVINREELSIWEYFRIFRSLFPVKVAHNELILSLTTHSNCYHITFFCKSLSIVEDSLNSVFSSISFPIFCSMILGTRLTLYNDDIVHIPLREIYEELRFSNSFSSF